MSYKIKFHTRWSDFDANKHMRHTAYNDYAAESRLRFLTNNGCGIEVMEKHNVGPVLFAENTLFKREILLGQDIYIDSFLEATSAKGERIKFMQHIYREDDVLAATVSVSLAWIDITKRKLTTPPEELMFLLNTIEKTKNFEEILLKK